MIIRSKVLASLIGILIFGGILTTTASGWWHTTSTKIPAKYTEGEAAGEYNPADIRGSYTFGEIQESFKVPVEDLRIAFALPADQEAASFQIKGLETIYAQLAAQNIEIGTDSVRYFVALYKGLPFTVEGEIYLLQPGVTLLKSKATLSDEQIAYLEKHAISPAQATIPSVTDTAVAGSVPTFTPAAEEKIIKGKTTFEELDAWGVSKSAIEAIIKEASPPPATSIRDFCTAHGLDFETVKIALQAEVEKLTEQK